METIKDDGFAVCHYGSHLQQRGSCFICQPGLPGAFLLVWSSGHLRAIVLLDTLGPAKCSGNEKNLHPRRKIEKKTGSLHIGL